MKKTLCLAAALMLLSAPVFAQGATGSEGEGLAREGRERGTMRRSGSAAPATMPGSQLAAPRRGKKMMRHKRSSKKMMRRRM